MIYGQLHATKKMNEFIYQCFSYISDDDVRKFVKKFKEQPHESDHFMHTVRELILGAYLGLCGLKLKYDRKINNKTPDWSILDDTNIPHCIIELVNFHIDRRTEIDIESQKRAKGIASYWRDGNKDNVSRLYMCIHQKAEIYGKLIENTRLPYIIAIFSDFRAILDTEEIQSCLSTNESGIFWLYPNVSGVLFFEENSGQYSFHYFSNTNAIRPFDIPNGIFPNKAIQHPAEG
jgi:hypothetical protein